MLLTHSASKHACKQAAFSSGRARLITNSVQPSSGSENLPWIQNISCNILTAALGSSSLSQGPLFIATFSPRWLSLVLFHLDRLRAKCRESGLLSYWRASQASPAAFSEFVSFNQASHVKLCMSHHSCTPFCHVITMDHDAVKIRVIWYTTSQRQWTGYTALAAPRTKVAFYCNARFYSLNLLARLTKVHLQ